MFIDRARIEVRSGDGGAGCVSFRREKFVPRGGPDGGDGGRGGDVILKADPARSTLNDFHHRQHFRAGNGRPGEGRQRSGRVGASIEIPVPPGTVAHDEDGRVLADLALVGDTFVVAGGGQGGRGNARFASSTNQAPRRAEPGRPGETHWLHLELRVLADVGLVGFPNVGKSTLLSRLTAARPKIAAYPFTTLTPHLGVVMLDEDRTAVLADIPGLIKGAHTGAGLGDRFLQHLRRTRLLLHLVDAASLPDRDPLADYQALRRELAAYGAGLEQRAEIVVLSRADLLQDPERGQALTEHLIAAGRPAPFPISGVTGEGLEELLRRLRQEMDRLPQETVEEGDDAEREIVVTLKERKR
jgi:GTP-binding protein